MQQHGSNILPVDPPPQPRPPDPGGWGHKIKIKLFQNIFRVHIKYKGVTNAATW